MTTEQLTFKQFQATRKRVQAPYMAFNDDGDFYTYNGTFTGEGVEYVEDCTHIEIFTEEQNYPEDATFHLVLGNEEWESPDLEKLERLLYNWVISN